MGTPFVLVLLVLGGCANAGEAIDSYGSAVADNLVWMLLAAAAAIAYVLAATRATRWQGPRWLPIAALGVISIVAVAWAWHLRWLADDAFISFRYARNWVDGHGLVFNLREPVDG